MLEQIDVIRSAYRNPTTHFGPLPGVRAGAMLAYEFALPARFEPWPGRESLERVFVLLDVGVGFAQPYWRRATNAAGAVIEMDPQGRDSWYVDLLSVTQNGSRYLLEDLYLDLIIPMDSRPYRTLDLDDFAQAIRAGTLPLDVALDGLERWQRFIDRYVQAGRWPVAAWSNFPPQALQPLMDLPAPLGPIVTWQG